MGEEPRNVSLRLEWPSCYKHARSRTVSAASLTRHPLRGRRFKVQVPGFPWESLVGSDTYKPPLSKLCSEQQKAEASVWNGFQRHCHQGLPPQALGECEPWSPCTRQEGREGPGKPARGPGTQRAGLEAARSLSDRDGGS